MATPDELRGALAARATALRPDRFALLLAAIAALGAGLVLAREAAYGVGLHFDSAWYLSTARNLLEGDGFVQAGGGRYENWPPLYPLLLAAASLGAFDPYEAAGPLNAAAFGLTVLVAGRYLRARLESRLLAVWGSLALALSAPLAQAASLALSEAPFVLFATLALTQADRALTGGRRPALLLAAAFAALACLTRYGGVALIAAVLLTLALQRGAPAAERARRGAAFALIAAAPLALWVLRNLLDTGRPAGVRYPNREPLAGIPGAVLGHLGEWALPGVPLGGAGFLAAGAAGAALIAAAAAVAWLLLRPGRAAAWGNRTGFCLFGAFALLSLLASVAVAAATMVSIQTGRYFVPLYVPLLVALLLAADRLPRRAPPSAARPWAARLPAARRAVLAALALWLCLQVPLAVRAVAEANEGATHDRRDWDASGVVRYVRDAAIGGRVHLNLPRNDLFARNGAAAEGRWLDPGRGARRALADAADGDHVAWFFGWLQSAAFRYGAADLRGLPQLRVVAELADGVVLRVDRSADHGAALRAARAAAVARPAAIRAAFGVHPDGAALHYVRDGCEREDAEARFFLHVVPADAGDLPPGRRASGFENLDFAFDRRGVIFGDTCMVTAALPDYPIDRVRTGQFVSGGRRLWEGEFAVR